MSSQRTHDLFKSAVGVLAWQMSYKQGFCRFIFDVLNLCNNNIMKFNSRFIWVYSTLQMNAAHAAMLRCTVDQCLSQLSEMAECLVTLPLHRPVQTTPACATARKKRQGQQPLVHFSFEAWSKCLLWWWLLKTLQSFIEVGMGVGGALPSLHGVNM